MYTYMHKYKLKDVIVVVVGLWKTVTMNRIEHSRSSKCSADDRREKNRLRNLDLREEGRNLNISGEEEIESSFKSELRSLKSLVAV